VKDGESGKLFLWIPLWKTDERRQRFNSGFAPSEGLSGPSYPGGRIPLGRGQTKADEDTRKSSSIGCLTYTKQSSQAVDYLRKRCNKNLAECHRWITIIVRSHVVFIWCLVLTKTFGYSIIGGLVVFDVICHLKDGPLY
jgi:hypothetical protein